MPRGGPYRPGTRRDTPRPRPSNSAAETPPSAANRQQGGREARGEGGPLVDAFGDPRPPVVSGGALPPLIAACGTTCGAGAGRPPRPLSPLDATRLGDGAPPKKEVRGAPNPRPCRPVWRRWAARASVVRATAHPASTVSLSCPARWERRRRGRWRQHGWSMGLATGGATAASATPISITRRAATAAPVAVIVIRGCPS